MNERRMKYGRVEDAGGSSGRSSPGAAAEEEELFFFLAFGLKQERCMGRRAEEDGASLADDNWVIWAPTCTGTVGAYAA